eukprot:TRINITY_DN945_c0_g3_i10.p1 TRINITY_DN945_c0_g3~~TRINITY_DN945_c0_g3_i10.p1  ORF type:complete len:344 (+),score=109.53 TRINITY_DN945_c0_g3_i10:64-1095(+)
MTMSRLLLVGLTCAAGGAEARVPAFVDPEPEPIFPIGPIVGVPFPPPPLPAPPSGGRQDHGRIVCPVIGMFVKNGLLVPDARGFVTKAQTKAAFLEAGVPSHIATETTEANFRSAACSRCPERINPFEMNTIRGGASRGSPFGGAQEHFRSTGIRDTDNGVPRAGAFDFGQGRCLPSDGRWTSSAVACFAGLWDRDPGCGGVTSNDVDTLKRPSGCGRCEGALANPRCASQLGGAIDFMFEAFRDPSTGRITAGDWRGMWLDLELPAHFRGGGGGYPPAPRPPAPAPRPPSPPSVSVCTGRAPIPAFKTCSSAPHCCMSGLECVQGRCVPLVGVPPIELRPTH